MSDKKILVLDDDDLVRETISTVLKREGYKAILAKNANEALEKTRTEHFDLIVSDIRMPGKNGVQAIKEIRAFFNKNGVGDIPIVFITGYSDMSEELKAEEHGEVILKPFDLDHLLVTIREYL